MNTSYSGSGSGQLGKGGVNVTGNGNAPQSGLSFQGGHTTVTPNSMSFGWAYLYTERLGAAAQMIGVANHTKYKPVDGFLLSSGARLADKQTPFREEVRMLLLQINDPQLIQMYVGLSQKRDEEGIADLHKRLVGNRSEQERLSIKRQAMVRFVGNQDPQIQQRILAKAMIKPQDFNNYASATVQPRSKKQTLTNFMRAGALFLPQLWEQGEAFVSTHFNFDRIRNVEQAPGGRYVRGAGPKEIEFGEKQAEYRLSRDAAFRATLTGFSEAKAKILLPIWDAKILPGLHVDGLNDDKKKQSRIMVPD